MDVWNPTLLAYTRSGEQVSIPVDLLALVSFGMFKWRIDRDGYVYRNSRRGRKNIIYYLHREIVDCPRGMQVDHKDNNPLNNHRENLAIVTPAENKALACIRRRWRIRYEGPKS